MRTCALDSARRFACGAKTAETVSTQVTAPSAAAMLDRLTHHCSIHQFNWESIRFTQSLGVAAKRKKTPRSAKGSE